MADPLAYWNGQLKPLSQVSVPITDAGFIQGATVAEQLRTFGGELFRLDLHLARLQHSLEIIEIDPGVGPDSFASAAADLAARNYALLAPGDDLGLSIFVTPGPYASFSVGGGGQPNVCIHTYPLPFALWSRLYDEGQALVVTDIRQTPAACWPVELKCRSRMHYFLADRKAAKADPGARALLLDLDGWVTEASTANILAYFAGEGLVSPPRESILPGISVTVLEEIARSEGVAFVRRPLRAHDVAQADELFLTSTSPCLIPVVRLDRRPIGTGRPGPMFRRLISAWGARVGLDVVEQAKRFSDRR